MESKLFEKIFFATILLVLILVSFLIIKPFLTAILTAMVFSYMFYPVFLRINKKIPSKNISAFIVSVLVILIVTLPLFFILNSVSKEAYATYLLSKQKFAGNQLLKQCQPADKPGCNIVNYVSETINNPQFKYYIDTTMKETTSRITQNISNILFSVPKFFLHMFISLFVMFFLFKDGKVLLTKIEKLMPLKNKHRKRVFAKINDMTYAVIYGSIIIAIIQGTLGGIGFFVFGLPTPLLWGLVMIFASLIPYVGSSVIWFPAASFLIITGYIEVETTLIIKGVLLLLYGIFIVGIIDNILKPKIIGEKAGLHPVLVLLGVIGGLQFLGFIGILIGPILIAMMVTFIKIYEEEKG